jgi:hypothetical protein
MACDAYFERSIQSRIDRAFPILKVNQQDLLNQPHQLVGTEIWLREQDEEKILLEGVTKIEFSEGGLSFHTVLGEEIRVEAEIKKSLLLDRRFVFELVRPAS